MLATKNRSRRGLAEAREPAGRSGPIPFRYPKGKGRIRETRFERKTRNPKRISRISPFRLATQREKAGFERRDSRDEIREENQKSETNVSNFASRLSPLASRISPLESRLSNLGSRISPFRLTTQREKTGFETRDSRGKPEIRNECLEFRLSDHTFYRPSENEKARVFVCSSLDESYRSDILSQLTYLQVP